MKQLIWIGLMLVIGSACGLWNIPQQDDSLPTLAPTLDSRRPDVTVSQVQLWWSELWQCGVEVHITIQNIGEADADQFTVSLHDKKETIAGLAAHAETTMIFQVEGTEMMGRMRATGHVDADNDLIETDELNNRYDRPLPYSAVPGLESISMCVGTQEALNLAMTRTVPPPTFPTATATLVPSPINLTALPPLPNLKILSAGNTYLPRDCWLDNGRLNRHVVIVTIANIGTADAGEFAVRLNEVDQRISGLSAGQERVVEFDFGYGDDPLVLIDPSNLVRETNESDNGARVMVLTFTPPATCTLTPSPSPT